MRNKSRRRAQHSIHFNCAPPRGHTITQPPKQQNTSNSTPSLPPPPLPPAIIRLFCVTLDAAQEGSRSSRVALEMALTCSSRRPLTACTLYLSRSPVNRAVPVAPVASASDGAMRARGAAAARRQRRSRGARSRGPGVSPAEEGRMIAWGATERSSSKARASASEMHAGGVGGGIATRARRQT